MTSQPPRPPDWWQQGQQSQPAQPGGPDGFGPPHQQQPYQQQPDPIGDPQQWAGPPRPPERGHGGRTAAAVVGLIAVAVLGSAGGYWLGHRDDGSSDTPSAPVVTTTPGTSSAGASPAASPSPRTSPPRLARCRSRTSPRSTPQTPAPRCGKRGCPCRARESRRGAGPTRTAGTFSSRRRSWTRRRRGLFASPPCTCTTLPVSAAARR